MYIYRPQLNVKPSKTMSVWTQESGMVVMHILAILESLLQYSSANNSYLTALQLPTYVAQAQASFTAGIKS